MKTTEFNNLKVGDVVYSRMGYGGAVSEINRTTKRISAIGVGNDILWRWLHLKRKENAVNFTLCGFCDEYEVVERAEKITKL